MIQPKHKFAFFWICLGFTPIIVTFMAFSTLASTMIASDFGGTEALAGALVFIVFPLVLLIGLVVPIGIAWLQSKLLYLSFGNSLSHWTRNTSFGMITGLFLGGIIFLFSYPIFASIWTAVGQVNDYSTMFQLSQIFAWLMLLLVFRFLTALMQTDSFTNPSNRGNWINTNIVNTTLLLFYGLILILLRDNIVSLASFPLLYAYCNYLEAEALIDMVKEDMNSPISPHELDRQSQTF